MEARLGELLPLDQIVYSAEVGHVKNEPEFFVVATRALVGPDRVHPIVFVDDSLTHVEVARRAGWIVLHFEVDSWTERMEDALGTAVSAR